MSVEIEMRVLGALISSGDPSDIKVQDAMLQIQDDYFYEPESLTLFKLIKRLFQAGERFEAMHLLDVCPKDELEYCGKIITQYWTFSSLKEDIHYLKTLRLNREIRKRLRDLNYGFEKEELPLTANSNAIESCMEISKLGSIENNYVFTSEMLADSYLKGEFIKSKTISSGIRTIDSLNDGGFREGSMITIAGRSGMGKTGFAVHLAYNIARNHPDKHVLFFSLEMTASDIFEKQVTAIAGRQVSEMSEAHTKEAIVKTLDPTFTIHAKPMSTIDYIEVASRTTHVKNPVSVIVVDYLGVVQNGARFESHNLKQADIALRLSALALELNCIVIALSQVNRDYSSREDKCPITSDAADSSGSERSSSYWLGIHRPEVDSEDDFSAKNQFIVKCRKNRFGNTWKATFAFNNATFGEVDQQSFWIAKKSTKGMKGKPEYYRED